MFKSMVVAVLAIGVAPIVYSQSAPSKAEDDAALKALDAEISETGKKDDGESVSIKPVRTRRRSDAVGNSSDEQLDNPRKSASQDSNEVDVTVMGKGETKEEAKLAAFRAAVEKAVGVWVDAESLMENDELLKDRVNTISNADIKRYETIKEWRFKSGLYGCQIQAWVEKKAIAPKFASVFPAAFADVGEAAQTIHVQKVTKKKRSEDAAALMTAALKDVDRMRNWVRLSVVKGKALEKGKNEIEEVKKVNYNTIDYDIAEVPGKGLYSVRYSMKIDENAYFKGFYPHFKEILKKMQEGEAEEDVLLTAGPVPYSFSRHDVSETGDGRKLVKCGRDISSCTPDDLKPFFKGVGYEDPIYCVDPFALSGFPGTTKRDGLLGEFMFAQRGGVSKIKNERSFNIWMLDRMNKDKTLVRCSAYKVPADALRAYWKSLYGELDFPLNVPQTRVRDIENELSRPQQIEIVLLDEGGEEIAARIDRIYTTPMSLMCGGSVANRQGIFNFWCQCNAFDSFFIRPIFVFDAPHCYSTEIQRDVYFPLTDAQLERVKQVKVRFVGGKRK